MNTNPSIRILEPQFIWNHFADLNAIPRASKKENQVIQFIKEFGERLNLSTQVDEVGNVIIKKPATNGMENRIPIVLQSHLDMVHQKNADTVFDFNTQGIEMFVEEDWVKAKGTTLGADNGIGVASIMSLLASKDIPHPALEALFTIDEETGMTGALSLKGGLLNGKIMLNLDTEEDNELTIGCAGGVDVTVTGNYAYQQSKNKTAFKLNIKGLTGGHSGTEIHLGRANANKLMVRFLYSISKQLELEIGSIDGGSLRNAIPRECIAEISIPESKISWFNTEVQHFQKTIQEEYQSTDPKLSFELSAIEHTPNVLNAEFQFKLLRSLYSCPNGIYRMSPDIKGLVQTSNNVARVLVKEASYSIQCLTRSSVESEKFDLATTISALFELLGAEVKFSGSYPGWTPKPSSPIVKLMSELYQERYHEPALVNACHAGLECGILGTNYPDMQMISFGPTIRGAHSPDEKVSISSVQKFWEYLKATLNAIPIK
ncbi:MAG: aminoacyl-histidine dipeptidase [Saprospiraceae bacterium]|nr:aminoacyl-histidine dipeptidase [Saprospiraceae bacterium]